MAKFDFISDERFRRSLESDYTEVETCTKAQAWKAVHVLVGSIIETILTDYLVSSDYKRRNKVDPLTMDLGQLINTCKKEGVLSEKTSQLSSAIKSYRNLIHPGRMRRLEETVDENTATVVRGLLHIVIEETATRRKEKYGYTAEQIVAKVENDPSSLAILSHLLKDTKDYEKERLLLRIIPERYFELEHPLADFPYMVETQVRFSKCFRAAFDLASTDIKKKITRNFLKVLKEEEQYAVFTYEDKFFRASDMQYLPRSEISVVKEHLLSRLVELPSNTVLEAMEGIEKFLEVSDVGRLVDSLIRALVSGKDTQFQNTCRGFLIDMDSKVDDPDVRSKVVKRFTVWVKHFQTRNMEEAAGEVREIMEFWELPS